MDLQASKSGACHQTNNEKLEQSIQVDTWANMIFGVSAQRLYIGSIPELSEGIHKQVGKI